jgi:hypothetical protein
MTRLRPVLSLALIHSASLLAADFWQTKEYDQWTTNEARRMLTDSPWARPVLVPLDGLGGTPASIAEDICRGCAQCSVKTVGGPGGLPVLSLTVAWQSALPVKQALARIRFGEEVESSSAAAEYLRRREDSFVISISGLPLKLLPRDPAVLTPNAFLRPRGRSRLPAAAARVVEAEDGFRLLLYFARGTGGGTTLQESDGQVEVQLRLGALNIHRSFRLRDMRYGGKLEL